MARRARSRAVLHRLRRATSTGPAARPRAGAGAGARPGRGRRAAGCSPRSRRRRGRRRLREVPAEPATCSPSGWPSSRPRSTGGRDELDAVAPARARLAADVDGVPASRRAQPRRLGRARRARLGAGRRRRGARRAALGRRADGRARLGDADRGRRVRLRRASGSGCARRGELAVGSPFDFREQALLYLPRGLPDPRAAGRARAGRRGGRRALPALLRARARPDQLVPRARTAIAGGIRGRLPYEVLVQGEAPRERLLERFRARSTRCSSRRRRSGRGSTCPASRCRCS